MSNEMSRRKFLLGAGSTAAAVTAGCLGGEDGTKRNPVYSSEEMEFMDRGGIDQTYAGLAENSAEMSLESYNQDMQMSGNHAGDLPERDNVEKPIIDLESLELNFTEVDSDTPAERYKAHLYMETNGESVYGDFNNFDNDQELLNERVAQAFGTVMHPTVGTLFNSGHGPDYRESQRESDQPALTGIEYELQDSKGNERVIKYDNNGTDRLSETYDEEINQVDAFTEEVLEQL